MTTPLIPQKLIKNVLVFCASTDGVDPSLLILAADVGKLLAENGFNVVYGGGASGLMGAAAKAAQVSGSKLTSVITAAFMKASWYTAMKYDAEHQVERLSERLDTFMEVGDAAIILPGGWGTIHEVTTLAAAADMSVCDGKNSFIHPIALLNHNGFWNPLRMWQEGASQQQFFRPGRENFLNFVPTAQEAVDYMLEVNRQGGLRLARGFVPYGQKSVNQESPPVREELSLVA